MKTPQEKLSTDSQLPVVFFDGICNLCNNAVQFIIKNDRKGQFRFASLQSDPGQKLLQKHQLPQDHFDSFLLLEAGQLFSESTAALRVCRHLDGGWQLFYGFIVIPRFLRDIVYRFIAKNRYRWFGKRDSCMLPDSKILSRFL